MALFSAESALRLLRNHSWFVVQTVVVVIGQALDIQINGRAFELEFRAADDVDFLLPNRQRLERVMIFLAFVALPPGPAARAECVSALLRYQLPQLHGRELKARRRAVRARVV